MLLQVISLVELEEFALHPLIFEQLHAILLIEVDNLDLMVLLLDIIIVIYRRRIITKFDLLIGNVALSIVLLM